jgi:hypothetical protein
MGMIPRRSKLGGSPLVLAGFSWSNGAFGDSRHSVLLTGVVLPDTMPVDSGSVVFEAVLDIDDDPITPFRSHNGSWILTIDKHHGLDRAASIRVCSGSIGNLEIVL